MFKHLLKGIRYLSFYFKEQTQDSHIKIQNIYQQQLNVINAKFLCLIDS